MVVVGGGGISHLSYFETNEFGDPNLFLFLLYKHIYHKHHPCEISENSDFQNNYWWITLYIIIHKEIITVSEVLYVIKSHVHLHKARTASVLNGLKNDPSYEFIGEVI
jgi:hypothetical protein